VIVDFLLQHWPEFLAIMKFYFGDMLVSRTMLIHLLMLSTTVNGRYLVGMCDCPLPLYDLADILPQRERTNYLLLK
jgi:hypothetical protein